MRTAASSGQGLMGPSLVLLITINIASAEIIKPWKEWLCNYCAMGKPNYNTTCKSLESSLKIQNIHI